MSKEDKNLLDNFDKPSYEDWVKIAEKSLKGKKITDLITSDYDGLETKPIYNFEDIEHLREQLANLPGEYPYLRGLEHPPAKMKPAVCGIIPGFRPEQFNKQLIKMLNAGQNAIHIKFISPETDTSTYTHGVVVTESDDFKTLLANVDLTKYPLYIEFDYSSGYAFDLFEKYLNTLDIDNDELNINVCFDPIANLADKGYTKYPLFDLLYCLNCTTENEKHKNSRLININASVYKRKGAGTVQEIAYALAEALEYIYHLLDYDNDIDEIAQKIHFSVSIGSDFFTEIAKIKAMRAFWAFIVRELGGNEKSQKMSLHLISDSTNKSPLDKETNILRETVETVAAIIAGADTLLLYPYTFPFEQADEFSLRVTKNIQLVLQHETDLLTTIDPAAGSTYIEALTNQIIKKIKDIIHEIDEMGGFLAALKQGYIQKEIKATADKRMINILTRKDTLVGVNKYPNKNDTIGNINKLSVQDELQQYLDNLDYDTAPPYLDEEPTKIEAIEDFNPAGFFYRLRKRAADYEKASGKKPLAFIAALGTVKEHKARVDFTRDFLATGGFEIEYNGTGYKTYNDAIADWEKSEARVFVICSTDENYKTTVPELCNKFKSVKQNSTAVLAGYPKNKINEYKQAGIDFFIHLKSDIAKIINELYSKIEN
jgi:methylmalonyl-CoA mutase